MRRWVTVTSSVAADSDVASGVASGVDWDMGYPLPGFGTKVFKASWLGPDLFF